MTEKIDFLSQFLATKKSSVTRKNYESAIHLCEEYLGISLENADEAAGDDYISYLKQRVMDDEFTVKTAQTRLSAVRSYAAFLALMLPDYKNPFEKNFSFKVSSNVKILRTPSLYECDELLAGLDMDSDVFLIFCLALRCGFTIPTLVTLKGTDFVFRDEQLYYHRLVPKKRLQLIPSDIHNVLIPKIEKAADDFLFVTSKQAAYAQRTMQLLVSDTLKQFGLSDYHLTDFRNRGIMEMLAAGNSEEDVAEYMDLTLARIIQFRDAVNATSDLAPCEMSRIRIMTKKKVNE